MSQKVMFILLNVCQSNVKSPKSVLISKGVLQDDRRLLATLKDSAILKSLWQPITDAPRNPTFFTSLSAT